MDNCRVLLIDSPADLMLLKESIEHIALPVSIHTVSTISEALDLAVSQSFDLVMIGSGLLIKEGIEMLLQLGDIPIAILCEASGLERFLKDRSLNVCFITRPFEINRIPEMVKEAYDFWHQFRSS